MASLLSGIKLSSNHHHHHHGDLRKSSADGHRPPTSLPTAGAAKGGAQLTRSPLQTETPVDEGNQLSPPSTIAQQQLTALTSASATSSSSTPAPRHKRGSASTSKPSRTNSGGALQDITVAQDGPEATPDSEKHAEDTTKGTGTVRATPSPPVQSAAANSAIDPLSQHIFLRTNTDHSIPHRLRNPPARPDSPAHMADGLQQQSSDLAGKLLAPTGDGGRDKKKGPSFLSRLSMRGSRRKDYGDIDSDSEFGSEHRTDGVNANVFSQAIAASGGGGGYIPHHKEPPRYIRTKAHNKKVREFDRMFLAQELVGTQPPQNDGQGHAGQEKIPQVTVSVAGAGGRRTTKTGGAIWASEFSKDGKYLAAAGRDHVVRVWGVLSTPEERRANEEEEVANGMTGERLSAPVFRSKPVQEFIGHTGEVLDLSWSKNNFLLSSSMDKTVRLWHISRKECLCTFKHKDFVTKLAFHPRDDRFFLAGSLDTMLRLWSIPDKSIAYSAALPDLVTAVAFSPDGKTAIAGMLNGICQFFETEGLKYQTQIHVRSSRGKNAKGSKITGIQTMSVVPLPNTPKSPTTPASIPLSRTSTELASAGDVKVLITSNDSRIRIYNLRDKSLDVKFKGHDNACSQISATFSDDGKYVICGSEDRKAYIWNLQGAETLGEKDKQPCEYFEAHIDMVTTALFAPTRSRMLLQASGDPIYDLCNPPPVTLRSLGETPSGAPSQTGHSSEADGQGGVPVVEPPPSSLTLRKVEESPAYIARSTHYDGNIIVTTDHAGIIKVFRQDCAFVKRKHDSWETGSTFSRKKAGFGGGYIGGRLGRSGSILTRHSNGSGLTHSRRGSLSQSQTPLPPGVIAAGGSSDRILSWRQGIEDGADKRTSSIVSGNGNGHGTPAGSERSPSPTKMSRTPLSANVEIGTVARPAKRRDAPEDIKTKPSALSRGKSKDQDKEKDADAPPRKSMDFVRKSFSMKRTKSLKSTKSTKSAKTDDEAEDDEAPSVPPTPSFTFRAADDDEDKLRLDPAGASYSFWNLGRWRGIWGGSTPSSAGGNHTRTASETTPASPSRAAQESSEGLADDTTTPEEATERAKPNGENHARRKSLGAVISSSDGASDHKTSKAQRRQTLPPSSLAHELSNSRTPTPQPPRTPAPRLPIVKTPLEEDELRMENYRRDVSPYGSQLSRGESFVSQLTSELEEERDRDRFWYNQYRQGQEDSMRCRKCGGRDFKVRKVGGGTRLSCGRCGRSVDE